MKKQIAVLMAAATAVTTVAPVLASADTTNYDASVSEMTAKIKEALKTRYKNKTEDGINPSNANDVDDYLNSRYAVVVYSEVGISNSDLEDNGVKAYDATPYATSKNQKVTDALKDSDVFGDVNKYGTLFNESNGKLSTSHLYVVENASKFENALENQVIGNNKNEVQVAIVDKGIKDGSAVETIKEKHYVDRDVDKKSEAAKTEVSLNDLANDLFVNMQGVGDDKVTYVDTLKITDSSIENGKETEYKKGASQQTFKNVTKVKLTLKSGKEYTLEANDKAFDLESPVDKDGKELTLNGNGVSGVAQNVYDLVEGFKYEENEDDKEVTIVLPCGDTDLYTVQDVETSTIELGKIFTTKDGYTKEGADLINGIIDARNGENGSVKFNYKGVSYTLADQDGAIELYGQTNKEKIRNKTNNAFAGKNTNVPASVIEKSGDGYQLRYNVRVVNSSDKDVTPTILQFVIKGDSQKDLATVLEDLNNEKGNTVVSGHFTRLEGANRYETAIEVSKDKFDPQKADTVVIVGGDALMDGLSAVPLASVKNAPILLSSKNGLSDATLNEISRACKDLYRKTVYVVGGENSVPEKAVKQLEERFGVVVMRVSGSDRYDTSLEVAKRLKYDGDINKTIYLAGGEGAADAMSVSPVAATLDDNSQVSPVLVVPKKAIKRSTRDFITKEVRFNMGYIIGGESTVSSNVYRDIKNAVKEKMSLSRVAGSDRYDTNVELLKKFYTNDNKDGNLSKILVNGAAFTSGDTKFLVDAQTAGPLAASKKAPIVLTGAKLTDDQVKLLKNNGLLSKVNTNVYQIGGVVSSDVMSVVVDKLGL